MDFDSELSQIQGALMRANNSHNFTDLKYRAGNANEIKIIVAGLFKLLSDKDYITDDGAKKQLHTQSLRRITFFLILNSDITILNKMVDSDAIGHIIWVTPLISKCILISFITELHLIEFYCETIRYGYPLLSIELLELAVQNIGYTSPEQKIKHVNLLVSSVYAMVARFIEYPLDEAMQKDIFSRAYEKVHELLKCFLETPKKNKNDKWNADKVNEHLGHMQLSMLRLLMSCFNIFEKKCEEIDLSDYAMYSTTYYEYNKNDVASNNADIILEYLSTFNELLLDNAKLCIMQISIDLFCCWFDFKESNDSDKTLQKAVGEHAYALQQMIKNNPSLEHEIGNMLDAIATKPLGLEDFIKGADRNEILINSNDIYNKNQGDWLASLIKKDFFFQDKECMECVIENVNILKDSDCQFIIESAKNLLLSKIKNEYPNSLKLLFLVSLSRLSHNEQVSCIIDMFSEHDIGNLLELPNYDAHVTEFLNKLVNIDDEKLFDLYKIFIQNPSKFYKKIIDECTKNEKQTEVMLKAMEKLIVFDDVKIKCEFDVSKYNNIASHNNILSHMSLLILNAVCEINTDSFNIYPQGMNYVYLIKRLNDNKILNANVILLKITFPKLHYSLKIKNLQGICIHIRVLQETFCVDLFVGYLAPLLVVLSQVLETVRWDMKSFSTDADLVIRETVVLQTRIMEKFIELKAPTDNEFKWLSMKLSNLSPMTAYYYQKLWPDVPFMGFIDKMMGAAHIQTCLRHLLPLCTREEFKVIGRYLLDEPNQNTILEDLDHVMTLIASDAHELGTINSSECLINCSKNHQSFIKDLSRVNDSPIDKPIS